MIANVKNIMKNYEPKIYGGRKESAVLIPLVQVLVSGIFYMKYEANSFHKQGILHFQEGKLNPVKHMKKQQCVKQWKSSTSAETI